MRRYENTLVEQWSSTIPEEEEEEAVEDERTDPIDFRSQGLSRSTMAPCEGMPRFAFS